MTKIKTSLQSLKLPFKSYLGFSLLGAFLTLVLVILLQKRLPPEVPLFYGAAEGEAQLVSTWALGIPSAIAIMITLANSTLATMIKDDFTKKTLVFMAMVATFFSIVTTLKIIFLVGTF